MVVPGFRREAERNATSMLVGITAKARTFQAHAAARDARRLTPVIPSNAAQLPMGWWRCRQVESARRALTKFPTPWASMESAAITTGCVRIAMALGVINSDWAGLPTRTEVANSLPTPGKPIKTFPLSAHSRLPPTNIAATYAHQMFGTDFGCRADAIGCWLSNRSNSPPCHPSGRGAVSTWQTNH